MGRPNHNPKRIKLFDSTGIRVMRALKLDDAGLMCRRGEIEPVYKTVNGEARFSGYREIPPQPSESRDSPADLTQFDMLANVGEPMKSNGFVSPSLRATVAAKVKEFGEHPGWAYRGPKAGYGISAGEIQ